MGAHAYAVTNRLSGLAAGSFTWAPASTTNRAYLNDARMDKQMLVSAAAASGLTLVIDLGSVQSLVGFALLNHNAAVQKTDAAVRVRAADDAAITVNVVTAKAASTLYSTTVPKNKDHVLQFASVTKRYWELTFTWTGTVTNFSVGEIFAYSAATQLTRRSIYGSGESYEAIVTQVQMQYGETRGGFMGGPVRSLDLQWDDLTSSQRDELYAMHTASNFGATPFLWIPSYEAVATAAAVTEQEVIYGRLQSQTFHWAEKDFQLYQPGGFSIRSLGREAGA